MFFLGALSPIFFIFHFRALLTEEMEIEYAHINGGGCNKLATCLLFHFPLREWPRSENRFWKKQFGSPYLPFFSFFIFEHFSQKKWKENTRTSMVAAVTSLLRDCFFIFHFERGLVLKIISKSIRLVRLFPIFFIFYFRALLTEEMEKKHAHINGGGCDKLATCLLFYFPLREWPRFENCFWKCFFWAHFPPFFSYFIFEHFSQKKWIKNTRTSMVATVTSSPRVRFLFSITRVASFWKPFLTILFWCAFPHSSSKAISFLFARSGERNGSQLCLVFQPHRHREAPPINRRRQVGWWEIERQRARARIRW